MESSTDFAQIEEGRFVLKGVEYAIDGDKVRPAFGAFDDETSADVRDGMFTIDGVRYAISEDGLLVYSSVDDNELKSIPIDSSGRGMYDPWRMEFQFSNDFASVSASIRH